MTERKRKKINRAIEREKEQEEALAVFAGNSILKTFAGNLGIRLAHTLGK